MVNNTITTSDDNIISSLNMFNSLFPQTGFPYVCTSIPFLSPCFYWYTWWLCGVARIFIDPNLILLGMNTFDTNLWVIFNTLIIYPFLPTNARIEGAGLFLKKYCDYHFSFQWPQKPIDLIIIALVLNILF